MKNKKPKYCIIKGNDIILTNNQGTYGICCTEMSDNYEYTITSDGIEVIGEFYDYDYSYEVCDTKKNKHLYIKPYKNVKFLWIKYKKYNTGWLRKIKNKKMRYLINPYKLTEELNDGISNSNV